MGSFLIQTETGDKAEGTLGCLETGDKAEGTPGCLREGDDGEVSCSGTCVAESPSDRLGGDHSIVTCNLGQEIQFWELMGGSNLAQVPLINFEFIQFIAITRNEASQLSLLCDNKVLSRTISRKMKGTEVPNPPVPSACDCTCCNVHSVLFLPMHSLLKGFRLPMLCAFYLALCLSCTFCFVPAYAKFAHEFLTLFHGPRATCLS